jgi:tetratricopeptide (TPR) repeat protein
MDYRLSLQFRIDAYGRPIAPAPTHGMAAAALFYHARNYAEAERCCRELIARDTRHFEALHLLGVICLDRSQLTDAVDYLRRAEAERPDIAQVQYHLGSALLGLKQYEDAEPKLRRALVLRPGYSHAFNNLGNALAGMGRHEDAIGCFRQALVGRVNTEAVHYNLGRSLAALDRLEEAVVSFRNALADASNDSERDRLADIHASLGEALLDLGQYDEALASCEALSQFRPGAAKWNRSLILLLLGRYDEGWQEYEGRWQVPDHDRPRDNARVPNLAEVAGNRILLTCEQGRGDMIQFARYAPLLARKGARVVLETYPDLVALMRTLDGIETVIAAGETEPPADIVTPLLSLPLVFGTTIDNIPARVPYLRAPTDKQEVWQQRLATRARPRVGIAWWGAQHIARRSLPIEALLPLLSWTGIDFHALQKDMPPRHRDWLAAHPSLIDHSEALEDFADTAALMSLLDLVITIDTSVAHLAGALGKPVWIMLPHSADWRWLLHRDDSPWYPTARLFRQPRRGNWHAVIADVAHALGKWSRGL